VYYPLALLLDGRAILLINEQGVTYYKEGDDISFVGDNFDDAIIKLIPDVRYWRNKELQQQKLAEIVVPPIVYRFSTVEEVILEAAGWTGAPADKMPVSVCEDYPLFPAAEKVLLEFGGLKIGICAETGNQMAYNNTLDINPKAACESFFKDPKNRNARTKDGDRYYPIGLMVEADAILLIDEKGVTWYWYKGEFRLLGETFDKAISFHYDNLDHWLK
jgi:hypothetical protein